MNTNQTIEERCAELARQAMPLAYRVATFRPMGRFNDPARVVELANRIIALRTAQQAQSEAGGFA